MTGYSACTGVSLSSLHDWIRFAQPASIFCIGLSPSIHSIDQIKVIDRFRGGQALRALYVVVSSRDCCEQKFHMKGPWQIWFGPILILTRKNSPYHLGARFVSRRQLVGLNPCLRQRRRLHLWLIDCAEIPRN